MGSREARSLAALGFLTVVEHEQHGFFGGYLVLNTSGRPIEFHCTAPVKPNRAQEILFGPALEPYLYGEQIGQTLIAKSDTAPIAICTDIPAALSLREFVETPVALVKPWADSEAPDAAAAVPARSDRPHTGKLPHFFQLGRNQVAVAAAYAQDETALSTSLAELAERFDLFEPFGRIRGAIDEAQRGGR